MNNDQRSTISSSTDRRPSLSSITGTKKRPTTHLHPYFPFIQSVVAAATNTSSNMTQPQKVLVTGASGMLGRSILKLLTSNKNQDKYTCVGTGLSRAEPPLVKLDLLDPSSIIKLMQDFKPNIVIHCAAERRPDRAAENPVLTKALNVTSTKILAEQCERIEATMIYISTDYVFDGGIYTNADPPYTPDSETGPVNEYGNSKLEGEREAEAHCNNTIIVRVPVLYATDCHDLSESASLIVAQALLTPSSNEGINTRTNIRMDDWGLRFPTLVDDVASVVQLLLDAKDDLRGQSKTKTRHSCFHVSSPESCTKYKLVQLMGEIMNVDASHVQADSEPPVGAVRPKNTQLDCSGTWEALGIQPYEFVPLRKGMANALEYFKGAMAIS